MCHCTILNKTECIFSVAPLVDRVNQILIQSLCGTSCCYVPVKFWIAKYQLQNYKIWDTVMVPKNYLYNFFRGLKFQFHGS